jgi:hypothetical protein
MQQIGSSRNPVEASSAARAELRGIRLKLVAAQVLNVSSSFEELG